MKIESIDPPNLLGVAHTAPAGEMSGTVGFDTMDEAFAVVPALYNPPIPSPFPMGALQDVLARPTALAAIPWTSAALSTSFYPYSYLQSIAAWKNKMTNFENFRATLRLRAVLNATPFHMGRVILAYQPFGGTHSTAVGLRVTDKFPMYTLRSIQLDPNRANDVTIDIPWLNPTPYISLTTAGTTLTNLGTFFVISLVNLTQVGQATANPVDITCYLSFVDVDLRDPTPLPFICTSKNKETLAVGPVTKIATTAASVFGMMAGVPVLAPFARASQLVANGVAGLATIFGFSRPLFNTDRQGAMVARPMFPLAPGAGIDGALKLTLDPLAELPLNIPFLPSESMDNLAIKTLATRPGYIASFTWTTANLVSDRLLALPVNPMACLLSAAAATTVQGTPLSIAVLPYKYWRGSLKYRFDFVTSPIMRGRVQIRHVPNGSPLGGTSPATDPTAYKCVLDISHETVLDVVAGWVSPEPMLPSYYATTPFFQGSTSNPVYTYAATWDSVCNGSIVVEVVNILSTTTASAESIVCLVSIVAGDDFEVGVPDASYSAWRPTGRDMTLAPVSTLSVRECHLSGSVAPTKLFDAIFGEKVVSLRHIIKRYVSCGNFASNGATAGGIYTAYLPNGPVQRNGHTVFSAEHHNVLYNCSFGFLGQRGNVRYKIFSTFSDPNAITTGQPANQFGIVPSYVIVTASDDANINTGLVVVVLSTGTASTFNSTTNKYLQGAAINDNIRAIAEFECANRMPTLYQNSVSVNNTQPTSGVVVRGFVPGALAAIAFTSTFYVLQAAADDFDVYEFMWAPLWTTSIV